jgi:hypothetical protein
VHAFEPVPQTRATLASVVRQNGLAQERLSSATVAIDVTVPLP